MFSKISNLYAFLLNILGVFLNSMVIHKRFIIFVSQKSFFRERKFVWISNFRELISFAKYIKTYGNFYHLCGVCDKKFPNEVQIPAYIQLL